MRKLPLLDNVAAPTVAGRRQKQCFEEKCFDFTRTNRYSNWLESVYVFVLAAPERHVKRLKMPPEGV